VVYVGKSSFKMKAAATTTPPSGVQPTARSTPTPPPGYVTRTLPPLGPPSRPPVPMSRLDRELSLTKATLAGVCMAAFSCGIVCSVAIYRFAPSLRPDCACAGAVETAEVAPRPAAAPPAEIAPRPRPPAPRMPDVEPLPSVAPLPVLAPPADVAPPPPARAAVPAPAPPRAAAPARPLPAARPAAAARKDARKDRAPVRKRAARGAPGNDAHPGTESWNDPFQ